METISGKFQQNPMKTVGGVAETRTSVDKMAKTDKGPPLVVVVVVLLFYVHGKHLRSCRDGQLT